MTRCSPSDLGPLVMSPEMSEEGHPVPEELAAGSSFQFDLAAPELVIQHTEVKFQEILADGSTREVVLTNSSQIHRGWQLRVRISDLYRLFRLLLLLLLLIAVGIGLWAVGPTGVWEWLKSLPPFQR